MGTSADALAASVEEVGGAELTFELSGSQTASLLVPLQTLGRQRLTDAARQFSVLAEGLRTLADNVEQATGGR